MTWLSTFTLAGFVFVGLGLITAVVHLARVRGRAAHLDEQIGREDTR